MTDSILNDAVPMDGQAERETLMNGKTDISPEARAQQRINDELRKKYKDIPGMAEIGELVQIELDVQLLAFRQANHMEEASLAELAQRWPDIVDSVNDSPLSQDAIATLTALSVQYSTHEVVAIVDDIRILGFTLDVVAEQPDLQINWRVIDA